MPFSYANNNIFWNIAEEISNITDKLNNGTIAVLPFHTNGNLSKNYGKYITIRITNEINKIGKLDVVKRNGIEKGYNPSLLAEINPEIASDIGMQLSVDAFIIGAVDHQKDLIEIFAHVIDTKTGSILKSISKSFIDKNKIETDFVDTWIVSKTANYFKRQGLRYKKIILTYDNKFEIHFLNNEKKLIIFKGSYKLNGNKIDYYLYQLLVRGKLRHIPRNAKKLRGTIYLVNENLYFTVTDMRKRKKRRLNAMNKKYRNIARKKRYNKNKRI